MTTITPVHQPDWIEVERPFPAFALSIPEAADMPASYVIRRHSEGGGRKDILTLGEPDSVSPYLQVEIYRPGSEISRFADPKAAIITEAKALAPIEVQRAGEPLASKFGPLAIVSFSPSKGTPRHCVGFVRTYGDPRLQLSGWFCQDGTEFIAQRQNTVCSGRQSGTARSPDALDVERQSHFASSPLKSHVTRLPA